MRISRTILFSGIDERVEHDEMKAKHRKHRKNRERRCPGNRKVDHLCDLDSRDSHAFAHNESHASYKARAREDVFMSDFVLSEANAALEADLLCQLDEINNEIKELDEDLYIFEFDPFELELIQGRIVCLMYDYRMVAGELLELGVVAPKDYMTLAQESARLREWLKYA